MARRRIKGNRSLPPGLYRWTKGGRVYWKIGERIDGRRTWTQLGPLNEADALEAYYAHKAGAPTRTSTSASRGPHTGVDDYLLSVYLQHIKAHRAPKTYDKIRFACEWLAAHFGSTPLDAIDTAAIERYKRWRRENWGHRRKVKRDGPPKASTINIETSTLRRALEFARTLGMLDSVPDVIRLPETRERAETPWLTAEQMDRLLERCAPGRRLLLLFALHTGMRPAEIASRTRADVDMDGGFVGVADRPEVGFYIKKGRPRVVPLTPALRSALREEWDRLPSTGPIFAGQSLKATVPRECERAGVPRISQYGTRHSFATRWASEGRSEFALARILGHSDIGLTHRYYVHLGARELAEQVGRLSWGTDGRVVQLRRKPDSSTG